MGIWERYRSYASGPLGLLVATMFLSTTLILGYKWGVSPVLKRRKRDRNEEFAAFIYEERHRRMIQSEEQ